MKKPAELRLREIEGEEARKRGLSVETFGRLLRKVEEYEGSHRARGLGEELLEILKEDLRERQGKKASQGGEKSDGSVVGSGGSASGSQPATAEVYIEELVLENFGPYYGRHEFDFRGVEGRRMILAGGKNGVGKTHLWRGAYLALMGESGRLRYEENRSGGGGDGIQV